MQPTAQTIPILPTRNFDATAAFYTGLGFSERGRYDDYLIVAHPTGIELHFWCNEALEPTKNDVGCYVRFESDEGPRALYEAWSAQDLGSARLTALEVTYYGMAEFALIDPQGNLVRVGGKASARSLRR